MRCCLYLLAAVLFLSFARPYSLRAQEYDPTLRSLTDSDGDGLSDALEQALLHQFAPHFRVSRWDCSNVPAEFVPGLRTPTVRTENSTIYGQAFPAKTSTPAEPVAEIHFYHLWKRDCGPNGHPLDAEHVSVLVRASDSDLASAKWKATYWFAAAHENTVCDVSQIARASALKAEQNGATIWISTGKHASFLNEALCHRGCGSDICDDTKPLVISTIINLGELDEPMNGALWISSPNWPLAVKLAGTDFPPGSIARLNELPATDIAWFHPGRHPAQGAIAISNSTAEALGSSGENTASAISIARDSTGNALQKGYDDTIHALGTSARHLDKFLRPKRK